MTTEELEALFEKHEDEFLEFDRIAIPLHPRKDLHAFLLLDELVPRTKRNMVSGTRHDEIYLDVDLDDLALAAPTEVQTIELIRCGVRISEDSLVMFV